MLNHLLYRLYNWLKNRVNYRRYQILKRKKQVSIGFNVVFGLNWDVVLEWIWLVDASRRVRWHELVRPDHFIVKCKRCSRETANPAAKETWEERCARVTLIVASQLIDMKVWSSGLSWLLLTLLLHRNLWQVPASLRLWLLTALLSSKQQRLTYTCKWVTSNWPTDFFGKSR